MAAVRRAERTRRAPEGVAVTRRIATLSGLLSLAVLLAASPARAGQVRVDVSTTGGAQVITPYVVNVNLGDHVVWVWKSNGHTVTNWSVPVDSMNLNFDGTVFDSDPNRSFTGQPSSTRFSWKSSQVGHVPYVCVPHLPDMSARVIVTDPDVSPRIDVADFRLSEVQYNVAGGLDLIEITNYGAASGDLGRFRIAITSGSSTELVGPAGAPTNIIVPSGGRVVVHLNTTGTNSNTDVFIASFGGVGVGLPSPSGALALYVPNTVTTGTPAGNSLSNAAMIIDFVQWGAGAQANEATAVSATFWGSGTFVPTVAANHAIEYCPDGAIGHGMIRWAEVATPNFGSDGGCATPVHAESWGRLKLIYR